MGATASEWEARKERLSNTQGTKTRLWRTAEAGPNLSGGPKLRIPWFMGHVNYSRLLNN
jgi:hypothetical protein